MTEAGFQCESDLVEKLLQIGGGLPGLEKWQNPRSIVEFDNSFGRADVIFFNLKKNWRESANLGRVSPGWAYVLRQLPYRKKFNLEEFRALAGVSRTSALETINIFSNQGFLRKTNSGDWIKILQPRPLATNIIAVEAKLKNWQRALTQAFRYLEYANESWVVLDSVSKAPALKNLELFIQYNIGLASLNIHGDITVHYKPDKMEPQDAGRYWQANASIAASLS